MPSRRQPFHESLQGCVVGTAVGDALGVPLEGMSAARAARQAQAVRHRFLAGRGVVSDDTEHTLFTLNALRHHSDADGFAAHLARQLRWWLAAGPPGIGLGTAHALIRSWLGMAPDRSGVASAGNGPAMRSAVIGVWFRDERSRLDAFVSASTRITHTDRRAEVGALAVARAAAYASSAERIDTAEALEVVASCDDQDDWRGLVATMGQELHRGNDTVGMAQAIGQGGGVSGFAYHSVPVALYAWLRHPEDYRHAITEVMQTGGDVDSTAAVTGALVGARVGVTGIPEPWRRGIADWPVSLDLLVRMAGKDRPPSLLPQLLALPLRNAVVFVVAVTHLLRRMVG